MLSKQTFVERVTAEYWNIISNVKVLHFAEVTSIHWRVLADSKLHFVPFHLEQHICFQNKFAVFSLDSVRLSCWSSIFRSVDCAEQCLIPCNFSNTKFLSIFLHGKCASIKTKCSRGKSLRNWKYKLNSWIEKWSKHQIPRRHLHNKFFFSFCVSYWFGQHRYCCVKITRVFFCLYSFVPDFAFECGQ